MSYKYKTKDGSDVVVQGVGPTKDGFIISESPIENPNLELVPSDTVPAPTNVHGVALPSAQVAQPGTPIKPSTDEGVTN